MQPGMRRVMIIGSGGAGKSTLALQLGEILNLPVFHLDALLWKAGWVMTPREDKTAVFQQLVGREEWIIDGNYGGHLGMRLDAADTVILLDLPRTLCLWGAVQRWWEWRARSRPDIGLDCPEKLDFDYLRWIWNYPRDNRPQTLALMEQYQEGRRIFRLRSRAEVARFVATARAATALAPG